MESEISAGLRNALARGQSLEQASQSFLNAGYNPQEVQAAAAQFSKGSVSEIVHSPSEGQQLPELPNVASLSPQKKSHTPLILVIVLVLLVILVGGLVWFLLGLR